VVSGQSSVVHASEPAATDHAKLETRNQKPETSPLFEDVSTIISHQHVEEAYDDFARQPLLPNKLSQLGPGVSWFDVDGDGREDLAVGSGKGGRLAVFHNDGHGGFKLLAGPPFTQPITRDQTTLLPWHNRAGET